MDNNEHTDTGSHTIVSGLPLRHSRANVQSGGPVASTAWILLLSKIGTIDMHSTGCNELTKQDVVSHCTSAENTSLFPLFFS